MSFLNSALNLKGRTALVTGSSGHLGRVFVESLAELGCDLILVDLDEIVLHSEAERLQDTFNVKVHCFQTDLESRHQRTKLIENIKSEIPALNILINNAAFVGASNLPGWSVSFESQSVDTWNRALEVNLTASFELIQGLTSIMRNSPGANVVNISSIYGLSGPVWELYEGTAMGNPAAYAASKGGLIQLTRWLATTLAPSIRVNSIAPGGVLGKQNPIFIKKYVSRVPLGRMAEPVDLVGVLLYLATDLGRYVTGQALVVDGGWSVW